MDDLTTIKGIGKTRAADLSAHNIDTFQALATADADFLARTMEVTPTMIAGWQKAASDLWEGQMVAEIDEAWPEVQAMMGMGTATNDAPDFTVVARLPVEANSGDTAVYEHFLTGRVKRN